MATNPGLSKKARRCFHRVISGLERGGQIRFLTLTSSPDAPVDIQASWRKLYMRLSRRGLIDGYIKCSEYTVDGKVHLHVLFRGGYISQRLLSYWWKEIHRSPVVDIRLVRPRGSRSRVASYMSKYMVKELAGRYSWSWGWVWRGFARHWSIYKRWWSSWLERPGTTTFRNCLAGWRFWLRGIITLDIEAMEDGYPPGIVIDLVRPYNITSMGVRNYEG